MIKTVDFNSDLGESFGAYSCGMDAAVLEQISSANVACGFHASDPDVMAKTVRLAKEHGVRIGAHPGFPDLQGFGRRPMAMTPEEVRNSIIYQIGALDAFCRAEGVVMQHVKPHGALYNMAAKDSALADAICAGIAAVDRELILLCPAGSEMNLAAKRVGLRVANEVFADRAYEEDGSLVSRKKEGAMITDPEIAAARVIRMVKEGCVEAITGKTIPVCADSICVHGDSPEAVAFARAIREALQREGVEVRPFG